MMTDDTRRTLDLIAERLALGHERYGPLDLKSDERRFLKEALEEILDFSVYITWALLKVLDHEEAAKPGDS